MECEQQRPRPSQEEGKKELSRPEEQYTQHHQRTPVSLTPAHSSSREHELKLHQQLDHWQPQQQDAPPPSMLPSYHHASTTAGAVAAISSTPHDGAGGACVVDSACNPASCMHFPAVPSSEPFKSNGSPDTDLRSLTTTATSMTADDVSVASTDDSSAHHASQYPPLRAGSVLSMDDPDVRIAAQALGDLRAGESPRCPLHRPPDTG
jgi:hypothetical protein